MSRASNRTMRRSPCLILPLFTWAWILCLLPMTASPAWPLSLELPEEAYQGDMIVGRVRPEAAVFVGEHRQAVGRDGYFAIGIERMQPADITVLARDGKTESRKIVRILARKWDIQRIDGLARRYVHPDPEQVKRIEADNRRIEAVRTKPPSPDPGSWTGASSCRCGAG